MSSVQLFKKFQRMISLLLVFLLVAFSSGIDPYVQRAEAATWSSFNPGYGVGSFGNEVAYGNGTWLLFSQSGDYGKSTDSSGTAFQKAGTVFPCKVLEMEHIGTQWLAACDNGKIYTLADGQDPLDVDNWSPQVTGKTGKLVGIATDGNKIVVVGDAGGTVLSSADGHNWFDRSIAGITGFNAVTYGEGKFIAVGKASDNSNVIYSSVDGESWTKVTTAAPSKLLYGIDYGAGKFVAVGLTGYLYVSDDGVTWEEKTAPDDTGSVSFATVTYGLGQFYVGGTSETILTSSDGSTFVKEIKGGSAKSVTSIAVANGKAFAVGSTGLVLTAAAAPPLSSNALLSNLTVTPGSLSFNQGTANYTVEVPYGTTSASVTPTLQDTTATLKVNGASRANGQATSVTLDADGSTEITIVVTAQNGTTTKTYTITVNEAAPSTNSQLGSLTVDGTLVSGFVKTTKDYSIEVPNSKSSVDVSWVLDEPGTQTLQAVKVDNIAQSLGPVTGLSLTPGVERVIEITVKAQDGTSSTYTLKVKRKLSSNANLSNLTVTPGSLSFNQGTTSYTVEVPYGTPTVTVTPTMQDTTATMTVNGTGKANSEATSITLDADGSTEITIVVTAQDGTTKTYTVTVNEAAPSTNSYLNSLSVNGTLVSGFVKTTKDYSTEVPNSKSSVDVSWVLDEPGTQTLQAVKVDNVAQSLGPLAGLSLTPGVERVIEITVKAQDGKSSTYTLKVKRKLSSDANLSNLTVTPGSLSFNQGTTNYTVEVPYATPTVTVIPTLQDTTATMTVNGTGKANSEATSVVLDADGSTEITIVVTAQDGTTKTYTITVNEAAPSTNSYLNSLTVDGTLVSGFVKTTKDYSMEVPNETGFINVEWLLDEPSTQTLQAVRVDDVAQALGPLTGLSLTPGVERVIEITVKAQDGTSSTYTLKVKRKLSSDANLSNLTLTPGSLSFNQGTTNYTVEVPYGTSTVTVTPTMQDTTATMTVNGTGKANSEATSVTLDADGSTEITIVVTAQDGTTKTYTITVNEAAPSTNSQLNSLTVDGTPVPGFVKTTKDYSMEVPNSTSSIDVSWVLDEPGTQTLLAVKVDSVVQANGPIVGLALTPDMERVIEITVKAQDGTSSTYTLKVKRKLPDIAKLSNLTVAPGELEFHSETVSYLVEVPYGTDTVIVTPTMQDVLATMKVNGTSRANSEATSVALDADGSTDITIVVTAQDGTTTKTYTITVNEAAPSSNGYLNTLKVNGTLVSGFVKTTKDYSMEVENETSSIDVNWVLDEPDTQILQSVKVDDVAQPLGVITGLSLTPGVERVIKITVEAQDGTSSTYTLKVKRKLSSNANLSNLTVTPGSLSFNQGTTNYTVEVPYGTPTVTVIPTLQDTTATMTVNGTGKSNSEATSVTLDADGSTEITIVVTAQDGTTKTYTITVNEAVPSTNSYLNSLTVDGTLVSGFVKTDLEYEMEVPFGTGSIDVDWVLDEPDTQTLLAVKVDSVIQANGPIVGLALTPGVERVIKITVEAQDGTSTTYTLKVKRKLSSNAKLSNLTVNTGKLTPNFASGTDTYKVTVSNSLKQLSVTPTLADVDATMTVNGNPAGSGNAVLINLNDGTNVITVVVTAPDGTTSTYTITVTRETPVDDKIKGTLYGDITKLIGNSTKLSADVYSADGKTLIQSGVAVNSANGKFELNKIEPGSYRMVLYALADNGMKLAGQTVTLTVNGSKEATASASVIDPFGVVTDSLTKKAIAGVKVTVYWADTELNRSLGRTPGTQVVLPKLAAMTNKNENGQLSTKDGQFGWLLLPEGDYYIMAEKEGYEAYDGRNAFFHVGQTAVKTNFTMQAKVLEEGTIEPYISGYPDGTFRPNNGITRAELAAVLLKVLKIQAEAEIGSYSDVTSSNWAAAAIEEVTKRGLMIGYPDGTFRPNQQVTRAEIAIVLGKVKQLTPGSGGKSSFHDIDGHWAKDAILLAEQAGLVSGYSDGTYRPNEQLTRAQAVVIFNKVLGWNELPVDKPQRWSDVSSNHWANKDIMRASVAHSYQKLGNGMIVWK
ncbi:cadherin-like beta sandwich domain-containing protein [Tumebacillus lipolyticus]|uniref:Cadherin-like beta sandwich domain-containing protein n=1 Tax=Tumebacillus lipolyticus TaxID=1280370 RepID=A0ABW4ZVT8_9BACL